MAAERIEGGPDIVTLAPLNVPGTEQVDACHFQSQPTFLPLKIRLRRTEQTRGQNVRLL